MKDLILRRFAPALLCLALMLGLAACGKQPPQPAADGSEDPHSSLSGGKGAPSPAVDPTDGPSRGPQLGPKGGSGGDPKEAVQSLALLYDNLTYCTWQVAGGVTCLGYREQGDTTPLTDWLQENAPHLTYILPFLLHIPEERILGAGYGQVYCIVPRDESDSMAVNHITWKSSGRPSVDELLYREEYAQPVLVFVNEDGRSQMPDIEVVLLTEDGAQVTWYPQLDGAGRPAVPVDEDGTALLLDFTFFGDADEPEPLDEWDMLRSEGCLPPTDVGLADTSWESDSWCMELNWGDGLDPADSGSVNLYHQAAPGQEYELAYIGFWNMDGDCLYLDLYDGARYCIDGSFPVLVSLSGESLYIRRDQDTLVCPPFFDPGVSSMELILSYG